MKPIDNLIKFIIAILTFALGVLSFSIFISSILFMLNGQIFNIGLPLLILSIFTTFIFLEVLNDV